MNRRTFSQLIAGTALGQAFTYGNAQTTLPTATGEKPSPSPDEFRFSIMLWTITKKFPIERCIEIAAEAGYNGVELVGEFKKWSVEDTRRFMTKMHSLGLVVDSMSGVTASFADPSGSAELMEGLTAQLAAAKDLECPQIILLSGKRIDGMLQKTQHLACIENLKRVADLASRHNVQIVIEPIDPLENPSIYLATVTEGFNIVREVGSENLKVLYDFYHEQRAFGNLIEKLEKNIDLIGLVHIADVPGRREPGTGEIDYRNIYRKLAELKYNKFIAMEYYPTGDTLDSLKTQRLVAQQAARTTASPFTVS